MKRGVLLLFVMIILWNCGARIKTDFYNSGNYKLSDNQVALLSVEHQIPSGAKKIGEAKFGDTGFSVDCDYDSNLVKARKLARENGANIVKVIKVNYPDLWSTCHRMKIEFYYYEGNVQEIKQYKIKIN